MASAGNDSQDAGGENFYPCINASLCVGAMNSFPQNGYFTKMDGFGASYSNYGSSVTIWAPTNIHVMPDGCSDGALTYHAGTSASAPYVAGVAALMKAVNPNLTGTQIASLIVSTSTQGVISADPTDEGQKGPLISPFDAVFAANNYKVMPPQVINTSPKNGAKVGETLYQA